MKRIRLLFLLCILALCLTGAALAAEYDGYLVTIKDDAPIRLLDALKTSASHAIPPELEEVYAPAGLYQVRDAATVERLRKSGVLLRAEPNYIVTLDDTPDFDDMEVSLLDVSNDAETQWYETSLDMESVRQKGITGEGVRVGVVDSGIFREHEEFEGVKILDGANYCVPQNDPNRNDVSDTVGHGTFVSGLIAAASNGKGLVGFAPGVELVPLKCFESKKGAIADIAAAIYDGVDTWQCQILNLSLGVEQDYPALRNAVAYADAAGVLMVAAAGNLLSGRHNPAGDPLNYPAAYPQVIGVGAVGTNLSVASFSYRNESVEVCAPGQNMRGPSLLDATKYAERGYGTSYASPIVAAAAALTLSIRPETTSAEFRDFLKQTVRDLGPEGYDTSYGNGLLQVGRLCAAANPEKMTFTATWKNYDDTVLKTASVAFGETPTYDGDAPVREGYTFVGWSPEPEAVAGDVVYTARFTPDAADVQKGSAYEVSAVAKADALNITLTNPDAVTVVVSYFDETGRFLIAYLTPVQADAGSVIMPLSGKAQKTRVMLLSSDYTPVCSAFELPLS